MPPSERTEHGRRRRIRVPRLRWSRCLARAPREPARRHKRASRRLARGPGRRSDRGRGASRFRASCKRAMGSRRRPPALPNLQRRGHGTAVTPIGVEGLRQSTTRRDRICLRGEVGGRAPRDALGPTWELRAPTAGTIAFVFSPARSGRAQWRRTTRQIDRVVSLKDPKDQGVSDQHGHQPPRRSRSQLTTSKWSAWRSRSARSSSSPG